MHFETWGAGWCYSLVRRELAPYSNSKTGMFLVSIHKLWGRMMMTTATISAMMIKSSFVEIFILIYNFWWTRQIPVTCLHFCQLPFGQCFWSISILSLRMLCKGTFAFLPLEVSAVDTCLATSGSHDSRSQYGGPQMMCFHIALKRTVNLVLVCTQHSAFYSMIFWACFIQ